MTTSNPTSTTTTTIAALAALVIAAQTTHASVIIAGLFDGPLDGGEPKVIELFVTENIADLTIYALGSANNGGGSDGPELTLSGSASAGDYIYIVDDTSDSDFGIEFTSYFGFRPPHLFDSTKGRAGGPAAINGNDAVELFHDPTGNFTGDETVTDVFGNIHANGSGAPWNHLDGWAYRKDGKGPSGSVFIVSEWTFSGINANDGKTSNTGPNVFPIGTFEASLVIPEPTTLSAISLALPLLLPRRRKT